ncbi:MAG: NADP(H)-dependent aldo-keto reductase [Halobacteriovorax sp.]|nr:NADP(H)-dependent aldo-keto reductase [Halobacteriovorax sp.]|tara:strand:- start:754 stop:1794 length:1041 start_codon:yes stop_codon:yes gene_type:complete
MKYNKLGNTDIDVSVICLGTMTWGVQNTIEQAHEQLDYALDNGVNFIDTAEMYPVPPTEETYTKTEQFIGKWDKLKTDRDKIILATKVAGPAESMSYIRGGTNRLDKKNIKAACEASLKRLNVDYIDLYQLHWPSRNTNFFGSLGYQHSQEEDFIHPYESLLALKELKDEGKIREFGLSNETPWGLSTFLNEAKTHDLPRVMSVQNPYNLLNRTYEIGMAEISIREKVGLLAYSPLGFGVLSGKYLDGKRPENARLTLFDRFTRYLGDKAEKATKSYHDIAKEHGMSLTQLSLSFVNNRNFLTSNIIGATTMDQLKENIDSVNVELNQEIYEKIERVHQEITNPCP